MLFYMMKLRDIRANTQSAVNTSYNAILFNITMIRSFTFCGALPWLATPHEHKRFDAIHNIADV